jgi:hypothetical protein
MRRVSKGELLVGKHVHLNGLDRFRFSMNHAPDSHGLAVNLKHFADQLLTALSFSAHMTAKHDYLRLA